MCPGTDTGVSAVNNTARASPFMAPTFQRRDPQAKPERNSQLLGCGEVTGVEDSEGKGISQKWSLGGALT